MPGLEKVLKAVANRRRLAILALLRRERAVPVYGIARAIRLSVRSTSRHLRILSAAEVVDSEPRGLFAYYRIANPPHPVVSAVLTSRRL